MWVVESLRVQQGEACRINIMWSSVSRAGQARAAQLPSLTLGETVAPTATPSVLPRPPHPMLSLLTHKRDRTIGDIGRTPKPIDAAIRPAIVAHRLKKSHQGIGHRQVLKES